MTELLIVLFVGVLLSPFIYGFTRGASRAIAKHKAEGKKK